MRRCIVHTITEPKEEAQSQRLVNIAKLHFRPLPESTEVIAQKTVGLRAQALGLRIRGPSIAEFLDAVLTCHELEIKPDSDQWARIERSVLLKNPIQTGDTY